MRQVLRRRGWCGLFVLLAVFPPKVSGEPWDASSFPNPQADVEACGREGRRSWVCDPDRVFSLSEANVVEGMLKEIAAGERPYTKSSCGTQETPGYQVAVAIMRQIEGSSQSEDSGYQFAKALHNTWGVGHPECNDGIVLVVSIDDRVMGISTGKGVKNRVKERKILDEMKPFMRRKDYAGGVRRGVYEIGKELEGKRDDPIFADIFILVFFIFVAALFLFPCVQTCKAQGVKKRLQMLKDAELAVRKGTYECTSCPVCFENFDDKKESSGKHRRDSGEEEEDDADAHTSRPMLRRRKPQKAWKLATKKARPPLTLQCGHTFCEACLLEWLEHNTTCPICRQSIPPVNDPSFPTPGYIDSQTRWNSYTWDAEMLYRLNRLGDMYPTYIPLGMRDCWYADYRLGRDFDYRNHPSFKSWDPAQRPSDRSRLESSGNVGSAGGFGGGRADGGGGASSDW